MKTVELTLPQVGLIAGTRGMLGAGLGLLAAGRTSNETRRAVGWTLAAVGALTTVPLVLEVLEARRQPAPAAEQPQFLEQLSPVAVDF